MSLKFHAWKLIPASLFKYETQLFIGIVTVRQNTNVLAIEVGGTYKTMRPTPLTCKSFEF